MAEVGFFGVRKIIEVCWRVETFMCCMENLIMSNILPKKRKNLAFARNEPVEKGWCVVGMSFSVRRFQATCLLAMKVTVLYGSGMLWFQFGPKSMESALKYHNFGYLARCDGISVWILRWGWILLVRKLNWMRGITKTCKYLVCMLRWGWDNDRKIGKIEIFSFLTGGNGMKWGLLLFLGKDCSKFISTSDETASSGRFRCVVLSNQAKKA